MLVHNGTKLHVFVADLSAGSLSVDEIQMFSKDNETTTRDDSYVHILETKNHFHLLIAVFSRGKKTASVSCRYKYRFSSSEFESVIGCELTVDEFPGEVNFTNGPYLTRETAFGKKSMWMFGSTAEYGSCLVEISVDDDGKLVQYRHKPPPFSCVFIMTFGQLSSHLLASSQPIFRCLTTKWSSPHL